MKRKAQRRLNKRGTKKDTKLWSRKEKIVLLLSAAILVAALLTYSGVSVVEQLKNQASLNGLFNKELEKNKVCMAGNEIKFKVILPVNIESKTYWACCEKCEAKLIANYKNTRFFIDQLSGIKISKADAVIFQNPQSKGKVLYFETTSNYYAYLEKSNLQAEAGLK